MIEDNEMLSRKLAEANQKLQQVTKELEAANEKLKQTEEEAQKAEKASQMKSLFLANMSHEIRTPLNAIGGFVQVIAETDSYDERMKYLEIVESNNARLLSLVNEILDLSRVEAGEITIKKEPTDLHALCNSIKQVFRFRTPDTVTMEYTEPEEKLTMRTDANRLTQVFSNLISNALKHTPKGKITYGYSLNQDTGIIDFYVSDTGSGISPEFIGSIFDTYKSKDAEEQKGFGLGLPLCKIIVEKMGGEISVESKVDEGTTFRFHMPFEGTVGVTDPTNGLQRTISIRDKLKEHGGPNKKTVLVAEDEESNYELVRIVLENSYNLLHAKNGIECVTMNEEHHPDLILMDIRMPDLNGLDSMKIIKEVNPETSIVALSAYAFPENIKEAMNAGCDFFLAKPFKVNELIETVEKYIKK